MKNQLSEQVELRVKVTPKAHVNEIAGWENGELRVRIAAVPEKGAANQQLIKFLAKTLGVAKSQIELVAGESSRHKRLIVKGISKLPF